LAIENHEKYTTKELKYLIKSINSKYVGICLDAVNSFGALETPKQVIDELAPYVINLHLKDFDIIRNNQQMGFKIIGKPAGFGKLDINYLFNQLLKYRNNLSIILELWTPFTETYQKTIMSPL
jgi:sugar phosphate isomerase/epimerase